MKGWLDRNSFFKKNRENVLHILTNKPCMVRKVGVDRSKGLREKGQPCC